MINDLATLQAAVVGHQHQIDEIRTRIAQLTNKGEAPETAAPTKKRKVGAAGRARIAAAQRARWAKVRAAKAAGKSPKKRVMSAEGKKRIAEATRKRWAEFRKAKKQTEAAGRAVKRKTPAESLAAGATA